MCVWSYVAIANIAYIAQCSQCTICTLWNTKEYHPILQYSALDIASIVHSIESCARQNVIMHWNVNNMVNYWTYRTLENVGLFSLSCMPDVLSCHFISNLTCFAQLVVHCPYHYIAINHICTLPCKASLLKSSNAQPHCISWNNVLFPYQALTICGGSLNLVKLIFVFFWRWTRSYWPPLQQLAIGLKLTNSFLSVFQLSAARGVHHVALYCRLI